MTEQLAPDIAARYRRLAEEFTRRVEQVPAGRWDDPSPCEGWTARDVLGHMLQNFVAIPSWGGVTVTLEGSVDDDPLAAWAEAREALQQILDDPARSSADYEGLFGRTSVAETIDVFGGLDLLIHGWDIARATGQDETLPADEVRRVHADAVALGPNLRSEGVCGPLVPVPPDAPEQDRLLGLLGRRP